MFPDSIKRSTVETAHQRNRVVAALAERIFVAGSVDFARMALDFTATDARTQKP